MPLEARLKWNNAKPKVPKRQYRIMPWEVPEIDGDPDMPCLRFSSDEEVIKEDVHEVESDSDEDDPNWVNELLEENGIPIAGMKASGAASDSPLKSCGTKRPRTLLAEMKDKVVSSIAGLTFAEKASLCRDKYLAEISANGGGGQASGGGQTSFAEAISRLEDPRLQINEVHNQWQLLSVAVDSGAAETVIPYNLIKGYPVRETDASRNGLNYASATGDPIPNLGEQKLPLLMQEGTVRGMTFQAAPVARPLGSVMRMCKAGHRVIFDEDGSYVENKMTGEINWMRQENGNYMLDMYVMPSSSFGRQP